MTDTTTQGYMRDLASAVEGTTGVRFQPIFPDTLRNWADELDAALARAEAAEAQLADTTRAKECFQRMTRAHWEALCAMRNNINEYVPMPNTDSGPLFSPENGPIYADIAERVVTAILALRDKPAPAVTVQEAANIAECAFDDRPLSRAGHHSEMDWTDGYRDGTRAAAAALRAIAGGGDE